MARYPSATRLLVCTPYSQPHFPGSCLEHTIATNVVQYGSVRCRRILCESASQVGTDVDMELHVRAFQPDLSGYLNDLPMAPLGSTLVFVSILVTKAALQYRLFCAIAVKLSTRGPGKASTGKSWLVKIRFFFAIVNDLTGSLTDTDLKSDPILSTVRC